MWIARILRQYMQARIYQMRVRIKIIETIIWTSLWRHLSSYQSSQNERFSCLIILIFFDLLRTFDIPSFVDYFIHSFNLRHNWSNENIKNNLHGISRICLTLSLSKGDLISDSVIKKCIKFLGYFLSVTLNCKKINIIANLPIFLYKIYTI